MGLGRFGGGEGLVQWLLKQGADVLVSDMADAELIEPVLDRLEARTGTRPTFDGSGHLPAHFTKTDLVVVNPAVPHPWSNPSLALAAEAGVPCTSAMRLLVERLPDRRRVIGITGTVGKSTTASMVYHCLCAMGFDARLGGNIGGSLLPDLNTITPDTRIILELSSAQLHWLNACDDWPGWSPSLAVTTNIAPNHLDWHGDEAHYRHCKQVLTAFQQDGDRALCSEDEAEAHDSPLIDLRVPGAHNQANARLAVATCVAAERVNPVETAATLADFPGLPHRLQPVDAGPMPRFWNDAKSSTPEATLLALQAFHDRLKTVHLLAGGYDKGVSLDAIAAQAPHLAGLYGYGATGAGLVATAATNASVHDTLDQAFASALSRMGEDDILLLSPGCASWDQFSDFRARGARFLELVRTATDGDDHGPMAVV